MDDEKGNCDTDSWLTDKKFFLFTFIYIYAILKFQGVTKDMIILIFNVIKKN